ncbi:hypothetical protein EOL70_02245 [Leucothrix sargassi]|nr:hypothetical protein EOL70_02245 [Leucothrix sargassi]
MKLTTSRYYLLLLFMTIFVISISVGVYLSCTAPPYPISKAGNYDVINLPEKDDTILTIQVEKDNQCQTSGILLTDKDLFSLPQYEFSTKHQWTTATQHFKGPLLIDVIKLACDDAHKVILTALNDYSITVDLKLIEEFKPIIAHTLDGQRMSIRDKGPLWVMIDHEKYNVGKQTLDELLIWQLFNIVVLNNDKTL